MEETKNFGGKIVSALPMTALIAAVLSPTVVTIGIFIAVLSLSNGLQSQMAAQGAELSSMRAELAAHGAELSSMRADIRDLSADVDTLDESVDVVQIDVAQIKVRVEEIERRLPDI